MKPIVKEDLCQVGKWREVGVWGWAEWWCRGEHSKGIPLPSGRNFLFSKVFLSTILRTDRDSEGGWLSSAVRAKGGRE